MTDNWPEDSVALRSDSVDVQADLELHCLHMAYYSVCKSSIGAIRAPYNTVPMHRPNEPVSFSNMLWVTTQSSS